MKVYKVVDFTSEGVAVKAFLEDLPEWLSEEHDTEDKQMDFLKSKLWIRIHKKFRYVNEAEVIGVRYRVLIDN